MKDKIKVEFLAQEEIDYILNLLSKKEPKKKNKLLHNNALLALNNPKLFKANPNKENATKKASESLIKATKEKIQNALNLLHLENKKPSIANVATTANIGYNTSKKYADMFGYNKN